MASITSAATVGCNWLDRLITQYLCVLSVDERENYRWKELFVVGIGS